MSLKKFAAVSCVSALVAGSAMAQGAGESRLSFGASTFGPTAEFAYRFHSNFSVRGMAGGLIELSPTIALDGRDYSTAFKPEGVGALIDWHTGLGGLRVSAGAVYSDTSFTGTTVTTAADNINIGGFVINTAGETIVATASVKNEIAPIATIGYDHPIGDKWVISGELGAIFNGGYNFNVTNPSGLVPQANLDAEARTIENDLNQFQAYPFVSIMIGTKFLGLEVSPTGRGSGAMGPQLRPFFVTFCEYDHPTS